MMVRRSLSLVAALGLLVCSSARASSDSTPPRRGTCDQHLGVICGMRILRGGYVAVVNPEVDASVYVAAEYALALDWWDAAIAIGGMVGVGRSGRELQGALLEIGARRYLMAAVVMPYVGGGLSPRLFVHDGVKGGLAPYVALGGLINVSTATKLMVEGRVTQNVLAVSVPEGDVYPTEIGVFVGWGG